MTITQKDNRIEMGDFQTPKSLASDICVYLSQHHDFAPETIIEPTCGLGSLLFAAHEVYPTVKKVVGYDINEEYLEYAKSEAEHRQVGLSVELYISDFFSTNWKRILDDCPQPVMVIGNPPWVNNTTLSTLNSSNLPVKNNAAGLSGLDAITGKSNFDISEWMLTRLLELLNGRKAVLSMLCKTAIARKVLVTAWRAEVCIESASIHLIDARKAFDVAVDACLLTVVLNPLESNTKCNVFENLQATSPKQVIAYADGHLIANIELFDKHRDLLGEERMRWRSGIKHDCAKVMELHRIDGTFVNGLQEEVDIEEEMLYPLVKSSDVANGRLISPTRWLLVTQHRVGEQTAALSVTAPRTWDYLCKYKDLFVKRKSSIYMNQPPFAIFGVGEYSFARWKVAISGLYKELTFRVVSPYFDKPVMLDDTCAFLSFTNELDARFVCDKLNSVAVHEFFQALVFMDAKRPITIEMLRKFDLLALARAEGYENTMLALLRENSTASSTRQQSLLLFT